MDILKKVCGVSNNYFTEEQSLKLYLIIFASSIVLALIYDSYRFKIKQESGILLTIFTLANYIFISLPVVSVIGTRDRSVGYDTKNYVYNYLYLYNNSKALEDSEIGYKVLLKISHFIWGNNYIGATLPMTFLTVVFVIIALGKIKIKGALPLGLYMFYMVSGLNMGDQARQLLAISILLIGFSYYLEGNYRSFLIYTIGASLFHYSCIFAIVLLLIKEGNKNAGLRINIFWGIWAASLVILLIFPIILYRIVPSVYKYVFEIAVVNKGMGLKWILDTMPIIGAMILTNHYVKSDKCIDRIPAYTVPFRLGGYSYYWIMRMYYIPNILGIYTVVRNYVKIDKKRRKFFCLVSIIVLFYLYFYIVNFIYDEHRMMNYTRMMQY